MAESKANQGQLVVGVALTGSRKSKYILKWALEKFLPEGNVTFKLIHVYPKVTIVPTPMGTWMPVAQVREEVVMGYRQETEWKKQRKLIPYLNNLKAQKIKGDLVLLESDEIPMAISLEMARQSIRHLVIGATSAGIFSMRNMSRGGDLSQNISENVPSFCSVYVIGSDGKLQKLRAADSEPNVIAMDDTSNLSSTSTDNQGSASASDSSQPKQSESLPTNGTKPKILARETVELKHSGFSGRNFNSGNASIQSESSSSGDSGSWISDRTSPGGSFVAAHSNGPSPIGTPPPRSFVSTTPSGSYVGTPANSYAGVPQTGSFTATPAAVSPVGTPPTGSYMGTPAHTRTGTPKGGSYVGTPPSVSFLGYSSGSDTGGSQSQITELEQLRIELRHIEKMYELSQKSSIDERLNEISKERLEEAVKLKLENSKELARLETNKTKAAQGEVTDRGEETEKNKPKNQADAKTAEEVEEIKNKLKNLFASSAVQYQKFTWEEIMTATSSLSDEFKIGMGAFGTVYKCRLHYTTVAVKVLHSKDSVTNKQFLEILSTIRHPHLLLLLGAVPEESCLVYEYMDHGSLDDRLFKKNGKPPLPWYDRFRICHEVAGALAFLHSTTPRPIIHRDLKPANILLDHNLVSKIGDAGLGTMMNVGPTNASLKTIYKETSPVGTLCYIDPEYQRTGRVSTKSDIYALGVVILQLLTAKPAVGIAYVIEDAIDEGTLTEILDPEAGEWPEKETHELAVLGLQCAELRGRDRPDLRAKILPVLERFNELANSARESVSSAHTVTPPHYFCPILKIKSDILLLESDDIPMALSLEIARQSIRHLVIGLTYTGIFSMKNLSLIRGTDMSQAISEKAPSSCSVYVIGSDAKLQQLRPADSEPDVITLDDTNTDSATTSGTSHPPSQPKQPGSPSKDVGPNLLLARETLELQHYAFKQTIFDSGNASVQSQSSSSGDSGSWISYRTSPGGSFVATHSNAPSSIGTPPPKSFVSTPPTGSYVGTPSTRSFTATPPTGSYADNPPPVSRAGTTKGGSYVGTPPAASRSGTPTGGSYAGTPPAVSQTGTPAGGSYAGTLPSVSSLGIPSGTETGAPQSQITEFEKLKIELKHIEKMYELSQNHSIDERFLIPLDQLNEISKERLEEAIKLKEEKAKELARMEKNKSRVAQSEVTYTGEKTNLYRPKHNSEIKTAQEAEVTKNKLQNLFANSNVQFQKFKWKEIMEATSSLSDEFKIGMGAFGTVYKCNFHYTTVAIKVLHSKNSVTNKQFFQELEILSTIRHPHLLLLLGAVPEESCLVYEYMDHGSLDDRLFKKNGKPPLPWFDRFRICYEVAGALAFLHNTTPRPIIHRDLKPANILLDHNLVSKIGDAGLGTMINMDATDLSVQTIYKETSPVGTLCYIDPEYQRTGRVSTKSDIYALGVVILQLLTAKPAVGISYVVQDAIDEGTLNEILDPEAGEWPEKETLELALLGLQCAELRGKDRPELRDKVLPVLERLNEVANSAKESASNAHTVAPAHYFCPILKTMMEDPYVAADGYTYERTAIEQWLTENDTSPTTKQPLPHKFILPNTTLLEGIKQWKSKNQAR
ncbi:U-box domain-containing protein 35 [Bienertia sinuspersici]